MFADFSHTASKIFKDLTLQYQKGQLAQTFLFYGPKGSKNQHIAEELSIYILSKNDENKFGFEEILTRKYIQNKTHPNFFLLSPEEDKKEITAEKARELNVFLQSTPTIPGWRIALILQADSLNTSASNILLKNMEELPSKTTIILVSESLYNIKKTILSRTQKIFFPSLSSSIEFYVKENSWAQDLLQKIENMHGILQLPDKNFIDSLESFEKINAFTEIMKYFVYQKVLKNLKSPAVWLQKYEDISDFINESKDKSLSHSHFILSIFSILNTP